MTTITRLAIYLIGIVFLAIAPAEAQRALAPVGGLTPYALLPLGGNDPVFNYAGREGPVGYPLVAGEHTTILIFPGDSRGAASDNSAYVTTNPEKVQDLSLENGQLYKAKTPALSCGTPGTGPSQGFFGHELADLLINGGMTQRVVVVCAGVGNTSTTTWINGNYPARVFSIWGLLNKLNLLAADRIFVIVSLGGRDQLDAVPAATVQANLTVLITYIRVAGFLNTPIYLALSSWGGGGTGGANGVAVRNGITAAATGKPNVYLGADTDTAPLSCLYDRNHYDATCRSFVANLWFNKLQGSFP